jgi:hypothetical protein
MSFTKKFHNFSSGFILYIILKFLSIYFPTNLAAISHNVPAVYDVLPARIRALRSKDQGWQNVAEVLRGNGAQRNDLAKP